MGLDFLSNERELVLDEESSDIENKTFSLPNTERK